MPIREARVAGLCGGAAAALRRFLAWTRGLAFRREATPVAAARQVKPVIVPVSLDDLRGPSAGAVELPVRLYWSAGSRLFDLADPDQVAALYDAVLDAPAATIGDITTFLNAGLLVSTWPALSMGRAKREAWERQFPALRDQRLAAAA